MTTSSDDSSINTTLSGIYNYVQSSSAAIETLGGVISWQGSVVESV